MNAKNKKIIQEAVSATGDFLKDKLPKLESHQERNPYAHLWRSIRDKMGRTYSACDDYELETILKIIAWHKENLI